MYLYITVLNLYYNILYTIVPKTLTAEFSIYDATQGTYSSIATLDASNK